MGAGRCPEWCPGDRCGDQRIKWKEVEARRIGGENLRWRRGLVTEVVTKAESNDLLSQDQRVQDFGFGSTVFMQATTE